MSSDKLKPREHYVEAVTSSTAKLKLVVAGPGTGKTYLFKQCLTPHAGNGLALTFINNLYLDLAASLAGLAESYTFHGFCKRILFSKRLMPGENPTYFPMLDEIVVADMETLGWSGMNGDSLRKQFYLLDKADGALAAAIDVGNYYNATGHTDCVYRVLHAFDSSPGLIPTYGLVVVDEYQDFNPLEVALIETLSKANSLLIAGDDDQALYGFKQASADFIRKLDKNEEYEHFGLPYCSRCTEVVVKAVNRVVETAANAGALCGRIDKSYVCHTDSKSVESASYPKIKHFAVSVEKRATPYVGRLVEKLCSEVSEADVNEAREGNYPVMLVIGPPQFVSRAYKHVSAVRSDVLFLRRPPSTLSLADGYLILATDPESNLGWRIVIEQAMLTGWQAQVEHCHKEQVPMIKLLDADFCARHLDRVRLLSDALEVDVYTKAKLLELASQLGTAAEALIRVGVQCPEMAEELDWHGEEGEPSDRLAGKIAFTTIVGSKGMSACHVCIVGANDGHLPKHNGNPSDSEICQFLVALSRTRKSCSIVSVKRFGAQPLEESVFVKWIRDFTDYTYVNKAFLDA